MKTHAIRIHKAGGPEELRCEEVDIATPGPTDALVRFNAVGVNFIDIYHRTGLYPVPGFPSGIGMEGAGVVEAVGSEVRDLTVGDRVACAGGPIGAYAEKYLVPAERLVRVPKQIADDTAAAMMLKGMTAQYLLRRTYKVKRGDAILFHAAAGGVGLIACQWAKHLGATVIGTAGSDEKAELARAHGCDHVIVYTRERVSARVREITNGTGVPVVYDSVGAATFDDSLDCLAPFGLMVSFGNASGPVPPFNLATLSMKGSLYITRPTLMTYTAKRDDLVATANELFDVVGAGKVKVEVRQRYPLSQAAQAHRDLEGRQTTGSIVLLPG
ncbi:MAG TPA: quinone oxidoreductase [Candidatus Acidoferrales bacterium]|nr:quinone oxidoreductase [Candidatus Acidoferrales bacterium]